MDKVSKDNPCPVCGKLDACLVAADGTAALCSRIESDNLRGEPFSGGWLHKLVDNPVPLRRTTKPIQKQKPVLDFSKLARQCQCDLPDPTMLSTELGVSVESLKELLAGLMSWRGNNYYTFPMKDGSQKIIGIRLWHGNNRFSVPGSKNALFWPTGVKADSDNLLFFPEGYSDTAAMRDMGFDAIGRPNCSAGLEYIKQVIKDRNRNIVLVADKDEAKYRPDGGVYYPGFDGAKRLAGGLKEFAKTIKIVKPPHHKDVRKWYLNGATKAMVMAVVDNARFFKGKGVPT